MSENYVCLFCGKAIERVFPDPCAAVLTATWQVTGFESETGQYWFHAACLRQHADPSVPLYFLDAVGDS